MIADESKKPTAFVIPSFDGGSFDKRYQETVRPALVSAGADPQRADQILGLQPIIQKIEQAIRQASICIAEVSTDNPNVWLELGYALALDRPTVILCDKGIRQHLPFDVQHRPVIFYSTDSKSGYEELERKIIAEVKNQLRARSRLESAPFLQASMTVRDTKDLKGYEIAILAALLALWPAAPNGTAAWEMKNQLARSGYSDVEFGLGISKLIQESYIDQQLVSDGRGGEEYFVYRITPSGISWLHQNEELIRQKTNSTASVADDFSDSDIPF